MSLLESGLAAGVALPYRCANGSCGDCRATVVTGTVDKFRFHDYTLTESEKLAGVCLLCSSIAKTDLTIEVTEADSAEDIPLQQLRGKVCHVEYLPEILLIRFKIIRGKALRFLPGQYTTLTLPGQRPRLLPIANCPCEPGFIEFHILHSTYTADQPRRNERAVIEGPTGVFNLRRETPAQPQGNKILITTGEHFAAIKPLIELMLSNDKETACELIWIATDQAGQYHHNLCRSWSDAFDWFHYSPLPAVSSLGPHLHKQCKKNLPLTDFYISATSQECRQVTTLLTSIGVAPTSMIIDTTLHN